MKNRFLPARTRLAALARELEEIDEPTAEQYRLAMLRYRECGELPADEAIASMIERVEAFLEAAQKTVPCVEPRPRSLSSSETEKEFM